MAFCVQCGVKLHASEKRCPLCGCPVYHPRQSTDAETVRPYPSASPEQRLRTSPVTLLGVTAIFLLCPAAVCLMIDWLQTRTLSWSVYPAGALGMVFFPAAAVILARRHRPAFGIIAGDISLCLFLWMVQRIDGGNWFTTVVLPVLVFSGMGILAIHYSVEKKILQGLSVFAVSFMMVGMIALAVDMLLTARAGQLAVHWSIFVLIPCTVVAMMLWIIQQSPRLHNLLKRVFHL